MKPLLWRMKRSMTVVMLVAWMTTLASAQEPADLESRLRDLSSPDLRTRSNSFYALLRPFMNDAGSTDVSIQKLLRAYPNQSEHVKTILIAALEREGSYIESTEDKDEQLSETATEYWADLSLAVASLRDPRAVKGLLSAHGPGGLAMSYFADLCPSVVDTIIEKSHQPPRYWRGTLIVDNRAGAMVFLGQCLTRVSAMQSAPDALAKVRTELLAALDDPAPRVRTVAAHALGALHSDPEVRAKLELVAGTDPYLSSVNANASPASAGASRFAVRDAARQALNGPTADDFYIVRSTGTLECRVEKASSGQPEFSFIGPILGAGEARHQMCLHQDRTGKDDPALCRAVSPQDACQGQP